MLIALLASTTVFAQIAGTYAVEVEGMGPGGEGPEVTLTLAVDEDGAYSATANTPMGKRSQSVEVDGNEFIFSTKVESPQGSMTMSYSGSVEDGELKGKVSAKALGMEMSFTGTLKKKESEERVDEEAEDGSAENTPEA
ncbi:MAG: hypothetical protein F4Z66_05575 [Gammaproteobacteria bacterium]|nr:hypothetical protein [Gammaproteobacteria bacterium]